MSRVEIYFKFLSNVNKVYLYFCDCYFIVIYLILFNDEIDFMQSNIDMFEEQSSQKVNHNNNNNLFYNKISE